MTSGASSGPQPNRQALDAAGVLRGDRTAVEALTRLIEGAISFRGFYVPASERADIVQEVVTQVWRALATPGASAPTDLAAFACALAYRRCVDWVRRRRPMMDVSEELPDQRTAPDRPLFNEERRRIGIRVLRELPERCRSLFLMHAGEGLTYREIAAREGRIEKTIRNQMSECLRRARDLVRRATDPPQDR